MAEPPNALTLVVFPETEPGRIYDALATRLCLTASAIENRERSVQVIQSAIAGFNAEPSADGPTLWYVILGAMFDEGLLNQRARERQNASRVSRTLLARLKYFLQELWWRLRD